MGVPWWLVSAVLFSAALLQSSFFPAMGLVRVRPDLVLQCVVAWAVLRGAREALPWAFLGGLLVDLFSGGPFGVSAIGLVVVAYCSSVGDVGVFRSTYILPLLATFWGSVLYGFLFLFLLTTLGHAADWVAALRYVVVPQAVVNTVCMPVTFFLLSRIERRTRRTVAMAW